MLSLSYMDDQISLIKRAGLSEAQAKAYLALMQNGKLSPTKGHDYTSSSVSDTVWAKTALTAMPSSKSSKNTV